MAIGGYETNSFAERPISRNGAFVSSGEFGESRAHQRTQSNILFPQSFAFHFARNPFSVGFIASNWDWPVVYGTSLSPSGVSMFWDDIGDQTEAPNPEFLPDGTFVDMPFDPRLPSNNQMPHATGFTFAYFSLNDDGDTVQNYTANGVPAPGPIKPLLPGLWKIDISERLLCYTAAALGVPQPQIIFRDSQNIDNKIILKLGNLNTGAGFLQDSPLGIRFPDPIHGLPGTFIIPSPTPEGFSNATIYIDTRIGLGVQFAFYPAVTLSSPGVWPINNGFASTNNEWAFSMSATRIS